MYNNATHPATVSSKKTGGDVGWGGKAENARAHSRRAAQATLRRSEWKATVALLQSAACGRHMPRHGEGRGNRKRDRERGGRANGEAAYRGEETSEGEEGDRAAEKPRGGEERGGGATGDRRQGETEGEDIGRSGHGEERRVVSKREKRRPKGGGRIYRK